MKNKRDIKSLPAKLVSVDFSVLLSRFSNSFCGGCINLRILPPQKESKTGLYPFEKLVNAYFLTDFVGGTASCSSIPHCRCIFRQRSRVGRKMHRQCVQKKRDIQKNGRDVKRRTLRCLLQRKTSRRNHDTPTGNYSSSFCTFCHNLFKTQNDVQGHVAFDGSNSLSWRADGVRST